MAETQDKAADQTSIRIYRNDRLMLSKLAGLRDVGVADLIGAPDVQRFFRGLMSAELAREAKQIAAIK